MLLLGLQTKWSDNSDKETWRLLWQILLSRMGSWQLFDNLFTRCSLTVFTLDFSRIACMAASLHRALRSAPTYPVVLCASSAMSTLWQTGILANRTDKMAFLCCRVGAPMITWRRDVKKRHSKTSTLSLLCIRFHISSSVPLCQISQAFAGRGRGYPAGWWLRRWGSDQTDWSRPSAWEAERPGGPLVPTSRFSSGTESPAHPRTAHRDPPQLQTERAQTQRATSPRSHPAAIPPPEIIIHRSQWLLMLMRIQ